ncbi:MAG: M1 family metallopeptidase [Cyclobacteriaceae bacterium]|nr:M1 family metallopeptidase [Cyclobacteriaceae bacterium]
MKTNKFLLLVLAVTGSVAGWAQTDENWNKKFEQLETILPTANTYRTASGAPGKDYWQQRADYKISVTLHDDNQRITGAETITYFNQSPDALEYLWLQLDQNMRAQDSNTPLVAASKMADTLSGRQLYDYVNDFDGGFKIASVKDATGKPLSYHINKTMMRLNLSQPLQPGASYVFSIEWSYNINDRMTDGGRSGLEFFPEDGNYSYTIAQFYPRMAVYSDNEGWQNKQFLGRGEFTLSFGNFEVDLTVPSDFIVGATGELQNPRDVLSAEQIKRFERAKKSFDKPVVIVTEEEAVENEKTKDKGTKTWKYKASNVRDFAFAASRKYIWDAMAVDINGKTPLAMSYYPKEGNPLWGDYSTIAVRQTLITYSKYTIDYPYPVAISVHGASIGMEYPMICFNFGRPNPDGSYTDRLKYGMLGVIIHEVGHNFFPMIINSDERQWTWMDEGLNTFVQSLTEKEFDPNFPIRRGTAESIVPYMRGDQGLARPIMTNSEQILQFGNNAYAKPAAALSILRETVMGPELFDYAFKTYAQRWAFKQPSPADFFRTMEDASAVDLDWFWRGWFYTTDNVDISVDNVKWYRMQREQNGLETRNIKATDKNLNDNTKAFGDQAESFVFKGTNSRGFREFQNNIDEGQVKLALEGKNFYEVTFTNKGGLVMPIILEWTYSDGTTEIERIPAEIWRMNEKEVKKVFVKEKEVVKLVLDPNKETADINVEDNFFPREEGVTRFDKFKKGE